MSRAYNADWKGKSMGSGGHIVDAGPQRRQKLPHGTLTAIPCPTCDAAPGAKCVNSSSQPLATIHIPRRRLAIRKYLQDRSTHELP